MFNLFTLRNHGNQSGPNGSARPHEYRSTIFFTEHMSPSLSSLCSPPSLQVTHVPAAAEVPGLLLPLSLPRPPPPPPGLQEYLLLLPSPPCSSSPMLVDVGTASFSSFPASPSPLPHLRPPLCSPTEQPSSGDLLPLLLLHPRVLFNVCLGLLWFFPFRRRSSPPHGAVRQGPAAPTQALEEYRRGQ